MQYTFIEVRYMPTLGEQLKALRVKRGMTQEQLAQKLNTTKAAISRYEKGQRQPKLEILTEIAMILDASPDELHHLYLELDELKGENGSTSKNAMIKWMETICGVANSLDSAVKSLSDNTANNANTVEDDFDEDSSPFAIYRADEEVVIQKLMEIFKKLDRDWQVELIEDAERYLEFQEQKKAKMQKLKQDVE